MKPDGNAFPRADNDIPPPVSESNVYELVPTIQADCNDAAFARVAELTEGGLLNNSVLGHHHNKQRIIKVFDGNVGGNSLVGLV